MNSSVSRIWARLRGPIALALILSAFAISSANVVHGRFAMGDFKAFYCAGRVVAQRRDPYATPPISQCESIPAPKALFVTKPGEVLPAPLPSYAVAAFVPLGILPFTLACVIWLLVLAGAIALSVWLFARAGVGDAWNLALALSLTLVAVCLPVGELPPIALLGIALAVWSARAGRPWTFAFGLALIFTEPQIGIAALVASCALGRRFAVPALATAAALGSIGLATLGVAGNLEYFRVVLPAHLLSELPSVLQYSLSWILYQAGVAPGPAILAGRISWIVMLGVTYLFARSRFARERPEIALLAAPAFAVVGGPFLHLDHIALAIPAAMWLATQRPSPLRIAAVLGLAIPVLYVFSIFRLSALVPFLSGWIGTARRREATSGLRAALAVIVVLALIAGIAVRTGTGSIQIPPVQPLPASLPQAAWAQYIGKHFVMTGWVIWLVKAPMWLAILCTAGRFLARAAHAEQAPA